MRWLIIALVFLATLINYVDRLTISVLAPVISRALDLTNVEFASLAVWFLAAYTVSQAASGRLLDRVGTRAGFAVFVTVWSAAAMATAAATSLGALRACRFVLGLGEAGNWPGAAKVVAEWFPVRERAFAMAIFNSGAALGAVVAPPVIVFLQIKYGWQTTFLVTGVLGFCWLALWLVCYDTPDRHRWLSDRERAAIRLGQPQEVDRSAPAVRWRELLHYPQVWGIVLARVITDPIWWLYITWLPKYFSDVRGFSLAEIGLYTWVPYLAADAGSLIGGAASGMLIARGWSVDAARRAVIIVAAVIMPVGALAARVDDAMAALALMSVVLFGFQVWINNVQTIPSDVFPARLVGSVAGLGGFGAGVGSMVFMYATGWIVDHASYTAVFTIAACLAPVGTLTLFGLLGRIVPARLGAEDRTIAPRLSTEAIPLHASSSRPPALGQDPPATAVKPEPKG